jgi:hypothetical protein
MIQHTVEKHRGSRLSKGCKLNLETKLTEFGDDVLLAAAKDLRVGDPGSLLAVAGPGVENPPDEAAQSMSHGSDGFLRSESERARRYRLSKKQWTLAE